MKIETTFPKIQYTIDGYLIVYISDIFYEAMKKRLESVARYHDTIGGFPTIALRDEPAKVEFRSFTRKKAEEGLIANVNRQAAGDGTGDPQENLKKKLWRLANPTITFKNGSRIKFKNSKK